MDFDVIVLGAGIVGVSSAVHLQDRGRRVALIDRRGPGEETSFGNAGLIERSSIVPYGFPRSVSTLLRYARNQSTDLYWDYKALPSYAGWLMRYWWESAPRRHAAAAHDMLPLISACIAEHDALIARAGAAHLVHEDGWIEAYRPQAALDEKGAVAENAAREHGLHVEPLDAAALHAREPGIGEGLCGGLHWRDPKSVRGPGALVKSYARLFESIGGVFVSGDATTLRTENGTWTVDTASGRVSARDVVIALGPWSDLVFAPLGYRIPLRAKRGYHMHYRPTRTLLSVPVVDIERGYVVAPMEDNRLRVTTGAELAARSAPPTGHSAGTRRAAGARGIRYRRAARSAAVARHASVHAGHAARDRARAAASRLVVRVRIQPSWTHARAGHGPSACGNDHRRRAFHGPAAVSGGTIRLGWRRTCVCVCVATTAGKVTCRAAARSATATTA
jgi:D-lysine oxidase